MWLALYANFAKMMGDFQAPMGGDFGYTPDNFGGGAAATGGAGAGPPGGNFNGVPQQMSGILYSVTSDFFAWFISPRFSLTHTPPPLRSFSQ